MSATISVQEVSKKFRLYRERPSSLKERIVHRRGARYDELWALRDVTLQIDKGSSFGLIGHNGSGKSTLLKLMAGIYQPTQGRVDCRGRVAGLLELGAGFHPELTGRENVFLNGSIMGLTKKEIERAFDAIVEFSGLEDFIDNPVKVYSSGMYVRLGFAVAVNIEPEILLVDEVIAVGDEEFQRKCMDHIGRLRRAGTTIVFVSHSLPSVETLCDSAAWLDHGRVKAEGAPGAVCGSYVEHVNQMEGERLERDAAESLPLKGGQVEITGIEFIGRDGLPTLIAASGHPITLRLHYVAHEPIEAPIFYFGFHHESGAHVAEPSSRGSGVAARLEGEGFVDYVLSDLPLLPGTYVISGSIWDPHGTRPYDYREKAYVLHVQPSAGTRHNGIVELGGEWIAGGSSDDVP